MDATRPTRAEARAELQGARLLALAVGLAGGGVAATLAANSRAAPATAVALAAAVGLHGWHRP
jgi:hypothetical protein